MQRRRAQSREEARDFPLFILGSHASVYETNMWRLKPQLVAFAVDLA